MQLNIKVNRKYSVQTGLTFSYVSVKHNYLPTTNVLYNAYLNVLTVVTLAKYITLTTDHVG